MKKYLFTFVAVALLLAGVAVPARAQEAPQIVSVNSPISQVLRDALTTWLQTSPPSNAVYYAVTFSQPIGLEDWYVSLVGLNITHPDDFWSISGDEFGNQYVIWLDTVKVLADGTVTFPFAQTANGSNTAMQFFPLSKNGVNLAPSNMPMFGAGGGSYVRFPWQPSKAVQFGILGIHAAEYGTDGDWGAVDLVSGSDMGSGAANDSVYASVAGTITYICNYGDTVAVRLTGNNDAFLYAHLLPNANLVLDHSFSAGANMGNLKHGTFTDECGNAFQQDDHWHLHWGFIQGADGFQAEGCYLVGSGPTAKWQCGNVTVHVLNYLYHYGNIGTNPDTGTVGPHDGSGSGGGPSFWDYLLDGAANLWIALVGDALPDHNGNMGTFVNAVMNGVKIVFRIANVLIRGNLNLAPAMFVVGIAISINLGLSAVTLAGYIIRILKSIPFV